MNLNVLNKYTPTLKRVLDIGANVGQFRQLVQSIYPKAFVYSIEANKKCESHLKALTNDFKITLLGEENKKVKFYISKRSSVSTGASIYKETTEHYQEGMYHVEELDMVRLDDLNLGEFDLIKIDTQGSELDVIRGGESTIQKCKFLLLEATTSGNYNENAPSNEELLNHVNSLGFEQIDILSGFNLKIAIQEDILFKNNRLTS